MKKQEAQNSGHNIEKEQLEASRHPVLKQIVSDSNQVWAWQKER